jgi:hypothetical protein
MVNPNGIVPERILMDAGFLAPFLAEFASSLKALAFSDLTIRGTADTRFPLPTRWGAAC